MREEPRAGFESLRNTPHASTISRYRCWTSCSVLFEPPSSPTNPNPPYGPTIPETSHTLPSSESPVSHRHATEDSNRSGRSVPVGVGQCNGRANAIMVVPSNDERFDRTQECSKRNRGVGDGDGGPRVVLVLVPMRSLPIAEHLHRQCPAGQGPWAIRVAVQSQAHTGRSRFVRFARKTGPCTTAARSDERSGSGSRGIRRVGCRGVRRRTSGRGEGDGRRGCRMALEGATGQQGSGKSRKSVEKVSGKSRERAHTK